MAHFKKEEQVLFPRIAGLENMANPAGNHLADATELIANEIEARRNDHEHEGARFRKIRILTHNYLPPADSCNTYRVTYAMLQDFEQDLHEQIHLENNILFARVKKYNQKAFSQA
jgi:regulator of cell morphogenesis and NO signaling